MQTIENGVYCRNLILSHKNIIEILVHELPDAVDRYSCISIDIETFGNLLMSFGETSLRDIK